MQYYYRTSRYYRLYFTTNYMPRSLQNYATN